jgi:hypothetical protein
MPPPNELRPEYAWPARSDELLRAAGYDPDAIRRRNEAGTPWKMRPRHMLAVLIASALVPALSLIALAMITRIAAALL